MNHFYGGLNGKDFSIKAIFNTRVDLLADLGNGWTSLVQPGEFVEVSYGMPNETSYATYRDIDLKAYGQTYNSTLWRKVYDEATQGGSAAGLSYELIASMTGATPRIDTTYKVLNADQDPYISWNNSNVDSPKLTIALPRSQIIGITAPIMLDCDERPALRLEDSDINRPMLEFSLPQSQTINKVELVPLPAGSPPTVQFDDTDVNNPIIIFGLPKGQALQQGTVTKLPAGSTPSFTIDFTDINKPVLNMALPVSQILQQGTTEELPAGSPPEFYIDNTDINKPVINFKIPGTQVLQYGETTALPAGSNPSFTVDNSNPNRPVLSFSIPTTQVLHQGETTILNADSPPSFTINSQDINNPIISFQLPQSQMIQEGKFEVLDANELPTFSINDSNANEPKINIGIPQAQVMQEPLTVIAGPASQPSVDQDNSDINRPQLTFTLPRAPQFVYGNLLGEKTGGPFTVADASLSDLEAGDYYINQDNCFIYSITEKVDETTAIFEYVTDMRPSIPEVGTVVVSPYIEQDDGSFVAAEPAIAREVAPDQDLDWSLAFALPKQPQPRTSIEFVGVDQEGSVEATPDSVDTVLFSFVIPRGAKIQAGIVVNDDNLTNTDTALLPGDVYINNATGYVYHLNEDNIWIKQADSLKGPVGDTLNIVAHYQLSAADGLENSIESIASYIMATYTETIENSQIFSIRWIDEEGDAQDYWYYCYDVTNNLWARVQFTGGLASMLSNAYSPENESDEAYSIAYINTLIGAANATEEEKTRKAYSATETEQLLSWGSFSDLIGG